MFKEFVNLGKNSIIYGIPDIVAKSVGFFMIPIYTRLLTPEDYGVMAMLMLFTTFVGILLPLGIRYAFTRYYFEGKNEEDKKTVYSSALLFLALSALIFVTLCLIFSKQISYLLFNSVNYSFYVNLMIFTLFFQSLMILPMQLFIAKGKAAIYASVSIASFLIHISLNVYLIAILKLGVLGFIYGSLISAAIIASCSGSMLPSTMS